MWKLEQRRFRKRRQFEAALEQTAVVNREVHVCGCAEKNHVAHLWPNDEVDQREVAATISVIKPSKGRDFAKAIVVKRIASCVVSIH